MTRLRGKGPFQAEKKIRERQPQAEHRADEGVDAWAVLVIPEQIRDGGLAGSQPAGAGHGLLREAARLRRSEARSIMGANKGPIHRGHNMPTSIRLSVSFQTEKLSR